MFTKELDILFCEVQKDIKHADHEEDNAEDWPVAHHLNEACGLQLQEDVRDDISSAQHTLQTISL